MSRVGEPLDLTKELADIKARLESLEQRLYTINQSKRFGFITKATEIPDNFGDIERQLEDRITRR